ncbi:sigma-70 family RNA polymerase sigma factor [Bacillus massilinigeriensis]|uniref:sigma-70 family RNA polymerase sigma factor n=1 Tax=Bacillus mediterraneensis TaxID=1805474 RepID=UPI0009F51730|nr:sigma-70 family RNA polymerase sigma factor [Bacillus mediterraneensis]
MEQSEELIIDFQDKDKAIEQLMDLYTKKVYLLAYSFVKDRGLAEDISQEVFLRVYKYLESFRGEASLASWIYRITANTSKDYLKKKSLKQLLIESSFLKISRERIALNIPSLQRIEMNSSYKPS